MNILYSTEKESTIWYYSPIAYPAFTGQEFKAKGTLWEKETDNSCIGLILADPGFSRAGSPVQFSLPRAGVGGASEGGLVIRVCGAS